MSNVSTGDNTDRAPEGRDGADPAPPCFTKIRIQSGATFSRKGGHPVEQGNKRFSVGMVLGLAVGMILYRILFG